MTARDELDSVRELKRQIEQLRTERDSLKRYLGATFELLDGILRGLLANPTVGGELRMHATFASRAVRDFRKASGL